MMISKPWMYQCLVFLSLLLPIIVANDSQNDVIDEPNINEEVDEEEEEGEEVLAKTDGVQIAMCMFGIMTALIAITCFFEYAKDMIYEMTEKSSLPIVNALFSEMTVLGFLSMVTFIVASAGFITDLSVKAFGEEREDFLKELFEKAHYMLFLVMVIFFFFAIFILDSNRRSIELLRSLREHLLRPSWLEEQLIIGAGPVPSYWSPARKEYEHACYFLEYVSMRNEFIFGRQGNFPHNELDKADRLPLDFDYARYLSIMLGHTMAKVIEVGASTWFQLWLLNVAVYMLLLAFPPVGDTLLVSCISWVALGYVEALFIGLFYEKVLHIRWCLCVPDELPHITFKYDSQGMPTGTRVKNHGHIGDYQPLQNEIELSRSPSEAPLPNNQNQQNSQQNKVKNFIHQNSNILTVSHRGSPAWVNIKIDPKSRSDFEQWLGGRAPFRQMYLYWQQANGPELHLTFLRLHLVYLSIQITILAFVFAPLILKHYGHHACWLYVLSPLPHVIYTVAYIISPLIRIVTEVGCVGVFSDNHVKKDVLRMMKTEKSMKGLMLLTNMKKFISAKRNEISDKDNIKEMLKKEAKREMESGKPHGGLINTLHHHHHDASLKEKSKDGAADLTRAAEKLFIEKFDTMEDGFCLLIDFNLGLATLGNFNESEQPIAFAMADPLKTGRVDLKNFINFFKRFYSEEQWKEKIGSTSDRKEKLSSAEMKVGTKLHDCFRRIVDGGGNPKLSPEEELIRLKRDHGGAVLQIEEIFRQHDTDGNMVLDTEEVRIMVGALGEDMTEAEAAALVNELDADGDGELSLAEFVVWAFHRHEGDDAEEIEDLAADIFDEVFDPNADGHIDVDEFITGLDRIKSDLSYNEKHDLFREADDNASGFIDREEFIELMIKYNS